MDAKNDITGSSSSTFAHSGEMSTDTTHDIATQTSESVSEESIVIESMPLTEFTLFMNLPSELRLRIWDFAMPDERIIEVLWNAEIGYYIDGLNRIPTILHVCVESRLFTLEKYTAVEVENIVENIEDPRPQSELEIQPTYRKEKSLGFYINISKDTLYLSMGSCHKIFPILDKLIWFLRNLDENIARRLQNLAAGFYFVPMFAHWRINTDEDSAPLLSRFSQLETVAMVVSDACMCTYWDDPRNFAPRREPLAITEFDIKNEFTTTKWCPASKKLNTNNFGRDWRERIPSRTTLLRQGLITMGMSEELVNNLDFPVSEIVRGDVSWAGLAQRYADA